MAKPRTTKKRPARHPAPAVERDASAPQVATLDAAIELHRRAAEDLDASEVVRLRADPHLALHNVKWGCDAVLAERAAIDATGFRTDWPAINALESVGLAVIGAHDRIARNAPETGQVLLLVREARALRRLLLANAHAYTLMGKAPAKEVERIRKLRGPAGTAEGLVGLAVLYAEHDILGAVPPAKVIRARTLWEELLERLRPTRARRNRARKGEQLAATLLRDRFWTLLVRGYEHLECAAGARWGRALGDHIPTLQTRHVPRKRAKKPPAPTTPA